MNDETLIWEAYENSKPAFGWLDSGGIDHLKSISGGKALSEEQALDIYLSDFFKSLENVHQQNPEYDPNNPPNFDEMDYSDFLKEVGGFSMGYQEFVGFLENVTQKYPSLNKFKKYLSPSPREKDMNFLEYLLQDGIIFQRNR